MTPAATTMLTITYNRLKDATVLAAYGRSDIPVPPFCLVADAEKKAFEGFESELINRLFALNAKRAEEERLAGAGAAPAPKAGPRRPPQGRAAQARRAD